MVFGGKFCLVKKPQKKCLGAFLGEQKEAFFWFCFFSAKTWLVSSSEPARYSSGSIGFVGNWIGSVLLWKLPFLEVFFSWGVSKIGRAFFVETYLDEGLLDRPCVGTLAGID